jgi:hypothetical protein
LADATGFGACAQVRGEPSCLVWSTTVFAVPRPRAVRGEGEGGPPVASAERQHVKHAGFRGLTAPATHLSARRACFTPVAGYPHDWDLARKQPSDFAHSRRKMPRGETYAICRIEPLRNPKK